MSLGYALCNLKESDWVIKVEHGNQIRSTTKGSHRESDQILPWKRASNHQ